MIHLSEKTENEDANFSDFFVAKRNSEMNFICER